MLRPRAAFTALFLAAPMLAGCGGEDRGAEPRQAAGAPESDASRKAMLAGLPPPYDAADLANGRRQFGKCRSCHTLVEGGPNLTGPNLHGVFGREAGTVPEYAYSQALVGAGGTWDAQRLDGWLADPRGYLPGNKMSFAGLKDAEDRRDLIGYLMIETAR